MNGQELKAAIGDSDLPVEVLVHDRGPICELQTARVDGVNIVLGVEPVGVDAPLTELLMSQDHAVHEEIMRTIGDPKWFVENMMLRMHTISGACAWLGEVMAEVGFKHREFDT